MEKQIIPVYKKLSIKNFPPESVITDKAGNNYITRKGVALLLDISLPALATTAKKNGLCPLGRYIRGHKPYLLEDVEQYYNIREKW